MSAMKEDRTNMVQLAALRRQLVEIRQKCTVGFETITPELAAEYLSHNNTEEAPNRRKSTPGMLSFQYIIENGLWGPYGWDAIAFDCNGNLVNGQHRMEGIARSGIAVNALVLRGIDARDVLDIGDTGMKRRAGQILQMHGQKNGTSLAATCVLVAAYKEGNVYASSWTKGRKVEPREAILLLEEFPDIEDAVSYVRGHTELKKLGQGTLLTFLRWITFRLHPQESDLFFSGLATGANLEQTSPVLLLRNRLLTDKENRRYGGSGGDHRVLALALIIKAWNCFIDGRLMGVLRIGKDEAKQQVR
jgi:hypothetical protein